MKRYASSLILLATLAVLLAGVTGYRWATGMLFHPQDMIEDRVTGESRVYRVEDGVLRVNINEADAAALQLLTGIGESLSQAVVDYRAANGPFHSVDDLLHIEGIGEGKLNAIRDYIYCE